MFEAFRSDFKHGQCDLLFENRTCFNLSVTYEGILFKFDICTCFTIPQNLLNSFLICLNLTSVFTSYNLHQCKLKSQSASRFLSQVATNATFQITYLCLIKHHLLTNINHSSNKTILVSIVNQKLTTKVV